MESAGTSLAEGLPSTDFDFAISCNGKQEIIRLMAEFNILDDEFLVAVEKACAKARAAALVAGHPVVFRDAAGRYVEERPEGKRFEIRFDKTLPRESHVVVLREISLDAA